MKILDDGRVEHTFHQSWLNTFFTCPEQARLVLMGEYPPDDSDASARGTAVHAAIEAVSKDLVLPDEALSIAFKTFREIAAEPWFRYVKIKTEATCLSHIEGAFSSWWDYVYPTLGASTWIEHEFNFVAYEDDTRVIRFGGTVDYLGERKLIDWKVSANKDKYNDAFGGDAWELKRWAIQPTMYCAAVQESLGFIPEFLFVNLDMFGRKPQLLEITRSQGDFDFLTLQCVSVAEFIESRGTEGCWPLNDQHALCSPKWCLNWDDCKGGCQ